MSRYNKNLGDFGEDMAESYLKEKGFNIIERNFYIKGGEIDIICMDEDTLVFVEVKTRKSDKFGNPAEAIDRKKAEHMRCAAERYYDSHSLDCEVRFDVVEVFATLSGGVPELLEIRHIKGAIFD